MKFQKLSYVNVTRKEIYVVDSVLWAQLVFEVKSLQVKYTNNHVAINK